MMFDRPIAISLSPNTDSNDFLIALKSLLDFRFWHTGPHIQELTGWFKNYFQIKNVYFFNSGRSSLYCLLKSFGIGTEDEIIIQGFTCVAVPEPVIWLGAKPVFVEIDDSLNIDSKLLEKAINHKTRAIIVQHTFGIPANIITIKKIAQKYRLLLIEDCAHSLGAALNGKPVGLLADAAFFSFGRDKIISSVMGGAAFLNNGSKKYQYRFDKIYQDLKKVNNAWLLKQLFHPLAFYFILPLYNWYVGKLLLYLLIKLHLLTKPVVNIELSGGKPDHYPAKLPNSLARLAVNQLNKLTKMNNRRREIADTYFKNLKSINNIILPQYDKNAVYLRFNILSDDRDNLYRYFRRHHILLGKWYSNLIDPNGVDFSRINYTPGSLPKARNFANTCLNLPTYPQLANDQVNKIIELFKKYADKSNKK